MVEIPFSTFRFLVSMLRAIIFPSSSMLHAPPALAILETLMMALPFKSKLPKNETVVVLDWSAAQATVAEVEVAEERVLSILVSERFMKATMEPTQ